MQADVPHHSPQSKTLLVSYTINPQSFLNHKRHAHLANMAWLAARREQAQSLPSEPL